ncbi:MAG TPA: phosphopyruvate hydratase, partial [Actinomycetota bacterium]|nr:phosphopyruvate hydratase [Actinomycetota bacterium]
QPLIPMPMVNILSGGAHAARAVDFQDFLVIPVGAESFKEAIEWASRSRAGTAEVLSQKGHAVSLVADEGGLGPPLESNRAALEMLVAGIERAGLEPGDEVSIAIDVASTQFYESGTYKLASEGRDLKADELETELGEWCRQFPVISLEDPCAEDDWDAWEKITKSLGSVQLLGDDLFVTDFSRVEQGIRRKVANAVLVKPNQAGTLTAARRVVEQCKAAGYSPVVSARSGETEDSWLADIAVGWSAGQIKVGSTTRSERTAKWNRLLRIERDLGDEATFAGSHFIGGVANA